MILHQAAAAALIAAVVLPTAGQTQNEIRPEAYVFIGLGEATRFVTRGSATVDPDSGPAQGRVGYFFDLAMRPVFRRRLRERQDVFRQRFLSFRGGVQQSSGERRETRGILEFTARYPLPAQFVAADRNRIELRFIHGDPFSVRYRNRLWLERDWKWQRFILTPFGYTEVFYDSRYPAWSETRFAGGLEIPAGAHVIFQPHWIRIHRLLSSPPHSNILSLTLNLYF